MASDAKRYFGSKFFKRLFLSYVLLIAAFVLAYAGWYIVSFRARYAKDMEQTARQTVTAYATAMDQQFFAAQSVCSAINSSETCNTAFQATVVEGKTPDAMQMYRLLNELKRVRASTTNMNVYGMLLCFEGDNKVYMPGGVMDFEGEPLMPEGGVRVERTTIAQMLGVRNHSQMVFNKEYLIWADSYTGYYSGYGRTLPRGVMMVLFETSGMDKLAQDMAGKLGGVEVLYDGERVMAYGPGQGRAFEAKSLLSYHIGYRLHVPEEAFAAPFFTVSLLPVMIVMLLGLMFMLATYFVSRHFYQPIGSISQMIEKKPDSGDDIDDLMDGIRGLIGERNGYRERMITISPYVRQGIVHSLISGGAKNQHSALLTDNEFLELRKPFFTVALVNIVNTRDRESVAQHYQDAQELIRHVCLEQTTDDRAVVCHEKNLQNMYVIVNSDEAEGIEHVFYTLRERIRDAIDDDRYAVTMGVSSVESDLNSLRSACEKAQNALNQMLTGGRDSVYFAESAAPAEERSYFFPKDAHKRMVKGLKEGNLADLHALLDEVYQRNIQEAELPLSETQMMLEEIHYTVSAALRSVYDRSTTHVRIQRLEDTMTVDEVFAYYKTVFQAALSSLGESQEGEGQDETEHRVLAYIEEHYCDPDLSLNSLADHFGVSTKVIGTICKKHYNTTFLQYVRERQIHRAAELLRTTALTLEEIAQQCGFINVLTFRRNFKAVMNMNPSDFRH